MKGGFSVGRLVLLGSAAALVFAAVVLAFPTLAAQLQAAPDATPKAAPSQGGPDATPQSAQLSGAPVATPQVVEQVIQKPNIPELTEDERSEAISIATNDPFVAQILVDREYSVASVGVWHTGDLKIGAGVILALAQTATLELDWPTIDYDRAELTTPPYQQYTEHYVATGVRRLVIMVDLQHGQVVSVAPGPEAGTPPRSATDLLDLGALGR